MGTLSHVHVLKPGAAKGIGFACARCLGREGAKVVVADIDADGAQSAVDALGRESIEASPFTCDVGSKPDVRTAQPQYASCPSNSCR